MIDQNLLRTLIHDVIHEVLAELKASEGNVGARQTISHIKHGVVTEKSVIQRAADGCELILVNKGVVVTPLAHDKARALKINIERSQ